MGESEGAFSLSAMLATDHPERLFHRVILESGSGALVHSPAFERKLAAGFPVRDIGRLKAMSTSRLLDVQEKAVSGAARRGRGRAVLRPVRRRHARHATR